MIFDDYNYSPQFIAEHARESGPYLDKDPEYKEEEILSDIPENVLDLYRDKPAKAGGKLYGLPPDSNCQMQYYRADVFEKAGPEAGRDVGRRYREREGTIEGRREGNRHHVASRFLGRGSVHHPAALPWRRLVRQDGARRLEGHHRHRRRPQGDGCADALIPFMEPTLNASDDEANTAMANGTWVYAPVEWGSSTMNDPKYTKFADVWKVAVVAKGANDKGGTRRMGSLGLIMPTYSHNKDAAWEWIKFCCSGDKQDPAIGKAWVENAGQPARISLLKEYTPCAPISRA